MTNKLDTKITVRANSELKQQFAEKAKANGTTPTALINQLMNDYVNGNTTSTTSTDTTTSTTTARPDETQQTEKTETSALEDRLAKVEATLGKIDEEGLSALLTAGNNIEYGNTIAQEAKKDISDLNYHFDELEKHTSTRHEALTNYLNQLRYRVEALEKWKEPIRDNLQANYDSISELKEKVKVLEASTTSTDSTNNDETPTDLSINGDSEPTKRSSESEEEEATSQQTQDKIGQYSTTSTTTAQTEETEYSESLTTVETEGSAIAQETKTSTNSTDTALTEETDHSESLTTEEAEGSMIAPDTSQPIALRPPRELEQGEDTGDLMTAKQLAEKLNCNASMISKWLSGKEITNPKYESFSHNYERVIPYGKKKTCWRKVK